MATLQNCGAILNRLKRFLKSVDRNGLDFEKGFHLDAHQTEPGKTLLVDVLYAADPFDAVPVMPAIRSRRRANTPATWGVAMLVPESR